MRWTVHAVRAGGLADIGVASATDRAWRPPPGRRKRTQHRMSSRWPATECCPSSSPATRPGTRVPAAGRPRTGHRRRGDLRSSDHARARTAAARHDVAHGCGARRALTGRVVRASRRDRAAGPRAAPPDDATRRRRRCVAPYVALTAGRPVGGMTYRRECESHGPPLRARGGAAGGGAPPAKRPLARRAVRGERAHDRARPVGAAAGGSPDLGRTRPHRRILPGRGHTLPPLGSHVDEALAVTVALGCWLGALSGRRRSALRKIVAVTDDAGLRPRRPTWPPACICSATTRPIDAPAGSRQPCARARFFASHTPTGMAERPSATSNRWASSAKWQLVPDRLVSAARWSSRVPRRPDRRTSTADGASTASNAPGGGSRHRRRASSERSGRTRIAKPKHRQDVVARGPHTDEVGPDGATGRIIMDLASIRIITHDVDRLTRFYEA